MLFPALFSDCFRHIYSAFKRVCSARKFLCLLLFFAVRCHMLEVDLATQFNPQNQQLYADAQEACQKCAKTILSIGQDVSKERTTPAATEMPISTLPATSTTEHQVSIMMVTPAVAAQEDSSVTTTPAIDAEQVSTAAISQAVAEQQVSIPTIMPVVPEQQVFTESSAPPTEKSLAPDVGHTNGDSQVASIVADCMEEGSQ